MSWHELMQRLQLPADQLQREQCDTVQAMLKLHTDLGLDPEAIVALFCQKHAEAMAEADAANPFLAESLLEPAGRIVFEASMMFRQVLELAESKRALDLDP